MPERDVPRVVGFMEALELISPKLASAVDWIARNQEVILNLVGQFFEGSALEATGWLPHPVLATIEGNLLQEHNLRQAVEHHYRANWHILRKELLANSSQATVDQTSKDVFADAVALHELGQYRAVCRLIFPELERMVRQELMQQRRGTATKLKELRRRLGELPASEHTRDPRSRALYLFAALETHLFEDIDSEEALQKFEASGIPNRHACVRGLIDYNSYQNSLNMLILADYCYSAIGRLSAKLEVGGADQDVR